MNVWRVATEVPSGVLVASTTPCQVWRNGHLLTASLSISEALESFMLSGNLDDVVQRVNEDRLIGETTIGSIVRQDMRSMAESALLYHRRFPN